MSDVCRRSVKHSVQKQEQLLNLLAEQMKLPLLQIARRAELAKITNEPLAAIESIEISADSALKLLDNYLLSTNLARIQSYLQLEPVSISAVLSNTAHELSKLAKQYECELELHLSGKYEPIMAHRAGLEAALTSLGYVFIQAQASSQKGTRHVVKLAAHRSRSGIVAGMFASTENLSSDMYRRARSLYGQARQPLSNFTTSTGAGVFVADSLLSSMSTHLRIARHQKLTGLAATFLPSSQLVLV